MKFWIYWCVYRIIDNFPCWFRLLPTAICNCLVYPGTSGVPVYLDIYIDYMVLWLSGMAICKENIYFCVIFFFQIHQPWNCMGRAPKSVCGTCICLKIGFPDNCIHVHGMYLDARVASRWGNKHHIQCTS